MAECYRDSVYGVRQCPRHVICSAEMLSCWKSLLKRANNEGSNFSGYIPIDGLEMVLGFRTRLLTLRYEPELMLFPLG
jgi:hypothetical protein